MLVSNAIGRRDAFIHVRQYPRPAHIAGAEMFNAEPGRADEIIHLAVQMTSAADVLPAGCQPILPARNAMFRGEAVLDEQQTPVGLENAMHFVECPRYIRNRAKRPSGDDR